MWGQIQRIRARVTRVGRRGLAVGRGDGKPARRRVTSAGVIALVVVLTSAYFVPRGESWNADTHIFLTASIVDRGSLSIDPLARYTGDIAYANGHYYADKAPGLSLAAVPVYALLKYTLLGGRPYTTLFAAPPSQRTDFLIRYLLAVVLAGLPTGLVAALLYTFLARLSLSGPWRTLVALTYGLGTFARPFANEFFSHQLATLLVFGGFVLVYRVRHAELSARYTLLAGVLLGYAIITEYPTALIAAAIGLYGLLTPPRAPRIGALLAAGALPPLLVGALYNTLAFGGPLSQGYAHLDGPQVFRTGQAQGFMGITYPHLDAIWQTTFGPYRGIFFLSPVLLLAIPGFVLLWRRASWRAETLLWLGIVCGYGLFSVSYFAWDGGYSMGPRQFLPALPFLMLPIGEVVRAVYHHWWRAAALLLAGYSVLIVELATAVGPLVAPRYASPLTDWVLPRLAGVSPSSTRTLFTLLGALARQAPLFVTADLDNNWGMLFHLPGLLQLLPLCFALAIVFLWHWRRVTAACYTDKDRSGLIIGG